MPCSSIPPLKPPLTHRIGEYLFGVREVLGVRVCVLHDEQESALEKVTGALRLLANHEPAALRRLRRDLTGGIRVEPILQNRAQFDPRSFSCQIELAAVSDVMSSEELALTLVHEATHARLWRLGVRYDEALRTRIEKICIRRELAVAHKLPDGQQWACWVKRSLAADNQEFLTDRAFDSRHKKFRWRVFRRIRKLGLPIWFVRTFAFVAAIARKISRRGPRSNGSS